MSSVIKYIKPINWFNYKGDNNQINFSSGTNILVGTNNAGKTKLHNAFRFILNNNVIIKIKVEDKKEFKEIYPDEKKYALDIFNNSAYSELKLNDIGKFGVELCFERKSPRGDRKYIVEKIIKLRKVSDSECEILENSQQIYTLDPYTKGRKPSNEKVDVVVNLLIRKMYRKFFLVEGEQMGMMTPLQGEGLKTTIKSLTDINSIDTVVDVVDQLQKKISSDKKKYESKISDLSKKDKALIDEKHKLETQREQYLDLIQTSTETLENLNTKLENNRIKFDDTKANKILLDELDSLSKKEKIIEHRIDENYRDFINSLTNDRRFNFSKLFDENDLDDDFEKIDNKFGNYLKQRRIELKKDISAEDQSILQKLVKTEPHPDILKEMVEDHIKKCYICKSNLEKDNIDFIKNVLIPHYEISSENDDKELTSIISIKDSIKSIYLDSRQYYSVDNDFIHDAEQHHADLEQDKIDIQNEIKEFVQTHGDKNDLNSEVSEGFLAEYAFDNKKIGELDGNIKSYKSLAKNLKERISVIEKKIYNNNKGDDKLETYNNIKEFIFELDNYFEKTKEDIYDGFAKSLEEKSSKRFKNLFRNNRDIKNHRLVVNVNKREVGFKTDYSFEIFLKNKLGVKLKQEGGASSTFEPLSVVFGLIDYANEYSNSKQTLPFIADAPVSRVTSDTKITFFETIINDEILSQNIIIVMDLWDNKQNGINDLGDSVLRLIESKKDSSFITLIPKENNTGVEFNYIKNGK